MGYSSPDGAGHRSERRKGRCIMKKRECRRAVSILLTSVLLLGTVAGDEFIVRAEELNTEWVDTGLLANGDFENETNGWSVTGEKWTLESEEWMTNNKTTYLKLEQSSEAFSMSQTISGLEAGTYKLRLEQEGNTVESGLMLTVADQVVYTLPAGKGYNNWESCETSEFILTEITDITVTIDGERNSEYWGAFDNIVLLKKNTTCTTVDGTASGSGTDGNDSSGDQTSDGNPNYDMESHTWKATSFVKNGDFETASTEGWEITTGSEQVTWSIKADANASNNKTQILNFWNGASADSTIKISQTISQIPAGMYYLALDLEGKDEANGLKISIDSADENYSEKILEKTTGWDSWNTIKSDMFILTDVTDLTITVDGFIAGEYWMDLDNIVLYQEEIEDEDIPDPIPAEIAVKRVENLKDDFIGGVDVSSYVALKNSGVEYYDFDGNPLDDQGFFNLLAASGINYVRIRVWNNPYDTDGNGYGGGNNDLDKAIKMGQWATNAGMRVLIDFHYSDFWADPAKQQAPKAWQNISSANKPQTVYDYTVDSLTKLINAGVDVGMVQVGNETNNGIAGEYGWSEGMLNVFRKGCEAVHAVNNPKSEDGKILAVLHFANPEKNTNYLNWAEKLSDAEVEYDVFASSYYPYWHGTLTNLQSTLGTIAEKYNKKVMVAETSWATTLEDGDGHDNTVRVGSNDTGMEYDFTIYGQALELRSVINTIANTKNGIGVFYWEPAWIPVKTYHSGAKDADEVMATNRAAWEKYGSGWAASYAKEYDPDDAGQWYGGSAVDNQALFNFDGYPLDTLNIFKYVRTGTILKEVGISSVENVKVELAFGEEMILPTTVKATLTNYETKDCTVTWNDEQLQAAEKAGPGEYVIDGEAQLEKTTHPVTCYLKIKLENILSNPGFEEKTAWILENPNNMELAITNKDVMSGKNALHFYAGTAGSYNAYQTIVLDAGVYTFGGYLMGGDDNVGDKYDIYVKVGDEETVTTAALNRWGNWFKYEVSGIQIEQDNTEVIVGVRADMETGAWGSWDDMYLNKTGEVTPAPAVTPQPTATPAPATAPEAESSSADKETSAPVQTVDWNTVTSNVQAKIAEVTQNPKINSVNMNIVCFGETRLPAAVLGSIKGSDVTLALHSGNGVAVSISGQDLKGTALNALQNIDLTVDSNAQNIPATMAASKKAEATKQLSVKDTGAFPVAVNIHVNVGAENSGKYANLYRYNAEKKQLEYCGSLPVTRNGQSMFALKQGGDYMVTVTAAQPKETVYFNSGDYAVKTGETLSAIAKRNHMSLAELKAKNPQIKDLHKIRVGQKVNLN